MTNREEYSALVFKMKIHLKGETYHPTVELSVYPNEKYLDVSKNRNGFKSQIL